ncbi:MAG: hypothetical protein LBR92_00165 [Puniceicoccales bacterium]|jgi:hypothetical protein|nr:hypothetical protein [Puniceicoccales bacterium]
MEMRKIFKFTNLWLMAGFVFVYSQALSNEFDIAAFKNDYSLASTIDPQNLPSDFNINAHKEMCQKVKEAHQDPLAGRNVIMLQLPDRPRYAFIVSGLKVKPTDNWRGYPVIDAYDILNFELNFDFTLEENAEIQRLTNGIKAGYKKQGTACTEDEKNEAEATLASTIKEKNDIMRAFLREKVNNVIGKIRNYALSVKEYWNTQEQKDFIDPIIEELEAENYLPTGNMQSALPTWKKNFPTTLNQCKRRDAKPTDRISVLCDLFHTEVLLRYAMENAIKVGEIDFGTIANQPVINICSWNDMCDNMRTCIS